MENKKDHNTLKIGVAIIVLIALITGIVFLCIGYYKKATLNIPNPIATMEVENFGTIKIELYPDKAPNTVKNFIKLANNGYYNGLKFHRVVKDFMIQGGSSNGDGSGSVKLKDLYKNDDENEYTIKGEMIVNGFTKNNLNLTEGVIAMARGADYTQYSSALAKQSYNSASSQFFIMTNNNHTNLSGYYCGFGKVIEGMDVVKKIAEVEVEANKSAEDSEDATNAEVSKPKKDVKIKKVTVETYEIDYGNPETMEPFNYMNWIYSQYGNQN